jgi:hypothetical protein
VNDLKLKFERATEALDKLKAERDELAVAVTKEDAERRADSFLEIARARAAVVEGHVANGAAVGDPLSQVLAAYCLSRPDMRDWLVQGQQGMLAVALTDKQKESKLAKLDGDIEAAAKEHLAAGRAFKVAEFEASLAGVAA